MFFLQRLPAAHPWPLEVPTGPLPEHDLFHQPAPNYEILVLPENENCLPEVCIFPYQLHRQVINPV